MKPNFEKVVTLNMDLWEDVCPLGILTGRNPLLFNITNEKVLFTLKTTIFPFSGNYNINIADKSTQVHLQKDFMISL